MDEIETKKPEAKQGVLYVVPTPIGNLEDMTFRAVRVLQEVTIIAAEDTRHTQKLLNHFDIKKQLISYHEHSRKERTIALVNQLRDGDTIALVSDAGMPAISDPGHELVKAAIAADVEVTVLPGANAALCALVGSGLPTDEFIFYGFLPRKKQEIRKELERIAPLRASIIFYESPYRIKATIEQLYEVYGNRQIALVREITKKFEQYVRGTAAEVLDWLQNHEVKGECCIVVEGASESEYANDRWWEALTIEEHVTFYEEDKQLSHKAALKQVAEDRDVPRKVIYHHIHVEK